MESKCANLVWKLPVQLSPQCALICIANRRLRFGIVRKKKVHQIHSYGHWLELRKAAFKRELLKASGRVARRLGASVTQACKHLPSGSIGTPLGAADDSTWNSNLKFHEDTNSANKGFNLKVDEI